MFLELRSFFMRDWTRNVETENNLVWILSSKNWGELLIQQCTYRYIRVTYKWHTDDIRVYTNDIRVHTSDIPMAYGYIRVTYGWHEYIRVTYEYIRVTYGWHTSTCFGLFTKIGKASEISFWYSFSAWVFHTNAPYLILYQLAKFQRHIFLQNIKTKCAIKFLFTQLMML